MESQRQCWQVHALPVKSMLTRAPFAFCSSRRAIRPQIQEQKVAILDAAKFAAPGVEVVVHPCIGVVHCEGEPFIIERGKNLLVCNTPYRRTRHMIVRKRGNRQRPNPASAVCWWLRLAMRRRIAVACVT